jgi:hypothetical protein
MVGALVRRIGKHSPIDVWLWPFAEVPTLTLDTCSTWKRARYTDRDHHGTSMSLTPACRRPRIFLDAVVTSCSAALLMRTFDHLLDDLGGERLEVAGIARGDDALIGHHG